MRDLLLIQSPWVAMALGAGGLVLFVLLRRVATRRGGRPGPRWIWAADLLLFPIIVVGLSSGLVLLVEAASEYEFRTPILRTRTFLLMVGFGLLIARFVVLFFLSGENDSAVVRTAPALMRGLVYAAGFALGISVFLAHQGSSLTGVLVSTGVTAAVAGLALQGTLSDLISGVALSIDNPLSIGEWVQLEDGTQGQVIDITWRSTRLKTWNNTVVVVPNGNLAQQRFINLDRPGRAYAEWYFVKVAADADPGQVRTTLLEAAYAAETVLERPAPVVRLADATTQPYSYMVWVHYRNFPSMFRGREDLFREIDRRFKGAEMRPAPALSETLFARSRAVAARPPSIVSTLRGLSCLKPLDDDEIQQLADSATLVSLDEGTVLAREGDSSDSMDILLVGEAAASIALPDGRQPVIERYRHGDFFGLASMLAGVPAYRTVTAATSVVLVRLDGSCFKPLFVDKPALYESFTAVVAERMAENERVRRVAGSVGTHRLGAQEIGRRLRRLVGGR